MTMSTYKSLGGPPGGLIVSNDAALMERIDAIAYPGLTANFDAGKTAALARRACWTGRPSGRPTRRPCSAPRWPWRRRWTPPACRCSPGRAVSPARTSWRSRRRVSVAARLRPSGCAAPTCWPAASGCRCPRCRATTTGLRLGVPEIVRLGMDATDMPELAGLIARALTGDPEPVAAQVDRRFSSPFSRAALYGCSGERAAALLGARQVRPMCAARSQCASQLRSMVSSNSATQAGRVDLHADLRARLVLFPAGVRVVDEIALVDDGLALRQAVGGDPHGLGVDREQLRLDQVDEGQQIMRETSWRARDVLVQAAVEAGVEIDRLQQRVGGDMLVVLGDALEQCSVSRTTRCVTSRPTIVSFQPAVNTRSAACGSFQMLASATGDTLPGSCTVPPMMMTSRSSMRQFGLEQQRQAQVAERAHRHQRDLARMRARHVDDELGRRARVDLPRDRCAGRPGCPGRRRRGCGPAAPRGALPHGTDTPLVTGVCVARRSRSGTAHWWWPARR